jgi:ankyrin repeat domain-containing protein 50
VIPPPHSSPHPTVSVPLPTSQSNTPGATIVTKQDFQVRVLQCLSQKDQDEVRKYTVTNTTDVDALVRQALAAARQKRELCEAKRWTFTFGSRKAVLGEKADSIVKWLDRFKQIGDVASNADPVHVGLPWVGIRLLLVVSNA